MDDELEELREKKRRQREQQAEEEQSPVQSDQQNNEQEKILSLFKQATTDSARERLKRFEMSRKDRQELADALRRKVAMQYQQLQLQVENGQLPENRLSEYTVNEDKMKSLLKELSDEQRQSYNIRRR